MRYVDEFRDSKLIKKALTQIKNIAPSADTKIMEVCGTHTHSFFRFGLSSLLPSNLRLVAGPGCPVCVSSQEYIDNSIDLAKDQNNVVLTFGDMLRVPGNLGSTLEKQRAIHGNVKVVYSVQDALLFALKNPDKRMIFLAVGFETTAPSIALGIAAAKKQKIKNLFFYSSLKLIPPAMEYLAKDRRLELSGFLCPGHVSCIIGSGAYEFMPKKFKIGCCVAGFEPLDILEGLYMLLRQIAEKRPRVQNQYRRAVTKNGNVKAKRALSEVFNVRDASWRGLGVIPASGLKIKERFSRFDAEKNFSFNLGLPAPDLKLKKCRCGDILKGLISPGGCPLFSKACTPEHPIGPCMVSSEGACSAHYKYEK
ncbi:MAG: hydrogenase formation protein HypD [Candidatus Omnitrophica bacterium]|nr:hydrogenase formation protein HypD [Candidatus Omnitrophota bacterium]MDD5552431.1 hydrogenase formation protein HypD [Candidatus Omnitrophota bacterium]